MILTFANKLGVMDPKGISVCEPVRTTTMFNGLFRLHFVRGMYLIKHGFNLAAALCNKSLHFVCLLLVFYLLKAMFIDFLPTPRPPLSKCVVTEFAVTVRVCPPDVSVNSRCSQMLSHTIILLHSH